MLPTAPPYICTKIHGLLNALVQHNISNLAEYNSFYLLSPCLLYFRFNGIESLGYALDSSFLFQALIAGPVKLVYGNVLNRQELYLA